MLLFPESDSGTAGQPSVCQNGGTYKTLERKCECEPDYTGPNCETGNRNNNNVLLSFHESNSHELLPWLVTNINKSNVYLYTSHYILFQNITDLKPTCHNNGSVVKQSEGVYVCQCQEQYTGTYCESGKLFFVGKQISRLARITSVIKVSTTIICITI